MTTPRYLTTHHRDAGTRFLVFPQLRTLEGFEQPVTIWLPSPPGSIGSGPRDDAIYVVDALDKAPYVQDGVQVANPPYRGATSGRRAVPDDAGHFDHIKPVRATAREFSCAAIYAAIRCTLMVWEHYLGSPVHWYFADDFPTLEVVPRVKSGTAWSRPGYIECGTAERQPLCDNFEIVAHEVGHIIVRGIIGHPRHPAALEYRAREESFADVAAMVTLLHFETFVAHLLNRTRGNLFSRNVLSNLGEIGQKTIVRHAFSGSALSLLAWDADGDAFKYTLAGPLTTAAFDVLVEIYERGLVARRAVPRDVALRSIDYLGRKLADVQREYAKHYRDKADRFEDALLEARDTFAVLMARTWQRTSWYDLYPQVGRAMIAAADEVGGRTLSDIVRDALVFRDIVPAAG